MYKPDMTRNGVCMCLLFFVLGCLIGARNELTTMDRAHIEVTWSMLLQPLPFVNTIATGLALEVALLMKSPITQQVIMKLLGGNEGEAAVAGLEITPKTEQPVSAASIEMPIGTQTLSIEIVT